MANRRCLKVCCGVTLLIVLTLVLVSVILAFTVFKIRDPIITVNSLGDPEIGLGPEGLNVTLNLLVTVENRNYGSFKFVDSISYVDYHGDIVAHLPLKGGVVPARGKHFITTTAEVFSDRLLNNPHFLRDFAAGNLNMTSSATLPGKATILTFKVDAKAISSCDISIFILPSNVVSKCWSKLKF
ncbi:Late embryogenesis abundant protein, LEA_2 subgroup [Dillenia turbinata]|uniref:Late embryogenesis abundant protein, LEA_2 subgroup n=1 Tax=Dillenia turbinata TaxID=194707 RepID=A0AAN8UTJ4_9MAGN